MLDLEIDSKQFELEPGKVIYPLSDIAFKNIFKDDEHRDYLAKLISIVTKFDYDYVIDNIVLVDTDTLEDKVFVHHNTGDLVVRIDDMKINVEACASNRDVNVRKNVVTAGKYYSNSYKSGDKYNVPHYFYQICINDFAFFHNNYLVNEAYFMESTSGNYETLSNEVKIYHVNLKLLKDKCYNELTEEERYFKLLITDDKESLRNIAGDNNIMKKVVNKLEVLSDDSEVLSEYTKQQILDYSFKMALIDKKKEGKQEQTLEIAKKMLEQNMDLNIIITCTGLTKQELEELM